MRQEVAEEVQSPQRERRLQRIIEDQANHGEASQAWDPQVEERQEGEKGKGERMKDCSFEKVFFYNSYFLMIDISNPVLFFV